jgi:predicted membrane protein (TIGR00267 family)
MPGLTERSTWRAAGASPRKKGPSTASHNTRVPTSTSQTSRNPEAMLDVLAMEELGIGRDAGGNPAQAALAAGISTGLGAIVPVLPFFWLQGTSAVLAAAAVSLLAHFLVGAAMSLVTLRTWWAAGLEMTLAGVVVGSVTYVAGLLFPTG